MSTVTLSPSGNNGSNDDVTVFDGTLVVVTSGALAKNLFVETIVNSTNTGGIVEVGGNVENATLNGAMTVFGSVSNLVLSQDGGWVTVGAGGSIQGASFYPGSEEDDISALSGAYIGAVTLTGRYNEVIASAGATVNGSVIESSNIQEMSLGSSENGTDIKIAGIDYSGGNASAVTIEGSGTESVSGTATDGLVESKGIVDVASGGLLESYTIAGTANVATGGSIENPVIEGGTLNLSGTLIGTVTFKGTGGTLNLIGQTGTVTTAGFDFDNSIIVEGITEITTATLDSSGVLTVGAVMLHFAQGEGMELNLTPQGNATVITLTQAGIECFVAGTRIAAMKKGVVQQVPVEKLVEGDEVVTSTGTQKIVYLGHHAYHGRFIGGNKLALPVCIKAGALAKKTPTTDLYVSPGHAFRFGDVLIQVRHLVNGINITQAESVESVHYYHIGLARHDLVFAEGAQAESLFPNDNASEFGIASQFSTKYPKAKVPKTMCLPLAHCGREVEEVRQAIMLRAPNLLHGYVDSITVEKSTENRKRQRTALITGWAQNRALGEAERAVELKIYARQKSGAERKIGSILANMVRNDLRDQFGTTGRHSFQILLPLRSGITARDIVVRGAGNGQKIPLTTEARAALKLQCSGERQIDLAAENARVLVASDGEIFKTRCA